MHISRIDLNLLVVLDAIFTEGGITRASHKLHLTQPAVSHALARLRDAFGDALFVREGRAMVPTPRARQLMLPVRTALRSLQVGLNELEQFDAGSAQRHFEIGVRDVLESALLPALMRLTVAAAPEINFSAVRVARRDLESELSAGTADVALDVLLPVSDRVRHQHVVADHLVVVMRREHPLAQRKLDIASYLRQEHVMVSSRRTGPSIEDQELSRGALSRRVRLRCQHYFTACEVVSQTDLLLTMPARHASLTNQHFDNLIRDFPRKSPALDVYLYWHASADLDPANRWLRERVIEALRSGEAA
jgi:DNA-binding transcriptional LysR family regulator